MRKKYFVIIFLIPFVVILDQLSKTFVHSWIKPFETKEIISGFFDLVLVKNRGLVFGLLSDELGAYSSWFFLAITLVAVGVIVHLFWKAGDQRILLPSALSLVLSGALGNLIDRFRWGYVVDFFHFYILVGTRSFEWPAFNVADIAITAGIVLLIIDSFLEEPSSRKKEEKTG